MDDYDKIVADLMRLERWQYIAFAAACAERVAVIFRSFGSPESVALYEQGLEIAWLSITKGELVSQAEQLLNMVDPKIKTEKRRNLATDQSV